MSRLAPHHGRSAHPTIDNKVNHRINPSTSSTLVVDSVPLLRSCCRVNHAMNRKSGGSWELGGSNGLGLLPMCEVSQRKIEFLESSRWRLHYRLYQARRKP